MASVPTKKRRKKSPYISPLLQPDNTSPAAQHNTATPRSSYVTATAHFMLFPWDAARMHGAAREKCSNEAGSRKRFWQQYLSTLTVFTTKSCKYESALFCMLIVQTNGWQGERRASVAVIQEGATAEVCAEEKSAAAPRTPTNTSARQQWFPCSPSQSSAPIPHHPYIPLQKKQERVAPTPTQSCSFSTCLWIPYKP